MRSALRPRSSRRPSCAAARTPSPNLLEPQPHSGQQRSAISPRSAEFPDFPLIDHDTFKSSHELIAVDVKAALIQIKADLPADPPVMLQIYHAEAGRHRWSPPFVTSKLVRLYAEAPRMRKVWARMVSIKNGRVDYRESRRKGSTGAIHEDRMFDVVAEAIRIAVPHEMVVHKISDNFVNVFKSVLQLHHRFKTGYKRIYPRQGPRRT